MKWLAAAVALLVVAIAFDLGLLAYAAYILILVFWAAKWVTSRWSSHLRLARTVSKNVANVGDCIDINLSIENLDRWPIAWMVVEDMLPPSTVRVRPSLEMDGQRMSVLKFAAGEQHQLQYRLICRRRGYFQIGPTVIETGDLFGFNRRFRVLNEPDFLMVYPRVVPLFRYDIASRRPIGEIIMTDRLFEDPTRIAGVRDYQPGDSLNRIHWKKSASVGTLQSKTYEASSLAGATIVLDFHAAAFDPRHEPVRSDLAITLAASIASALAEMGQQVGLVTNARHAIDRIREEGWIRNGYQREKLKSQVGERIRSDRLRPVIVPTRKSSDQTIRIHTALACLEITDGMDFPTLLLEASSQIPRDATVLAVVSEINMETAVALGGLKKRGYSVVAVVNTFSEDRFAQTTAALIANGIPAAHLKDESSIQTICERQALMR